MLNQRKILLGFYQTHQRVEIQTEIPKFKFVEPQLHNLATGMLKNVERAV